MLCGDSQGKDRQGAYKPVTSGDYSWADVSTMNALVAAAGATA